MQIQPISNKTNFRGKVFCLSNGGLTNSTFIESRLEKQLPKLEKLVKDKPFNLYITPNLMKNILFNVTPAKSFEPILNGERYRINEPYKNSDGIIDAAKEAIDIYEKGTDISYIKYPPSR